ncbi:MAG TPA: RIP metalloprotease RseP [Acidisarcina sp.]
MHSAIIAALSFFVVLGIMVLVHEFGHFAVAKFFGVRVEVFSIGMGKRLFGFKRGDTDYRLSLLPLGGYVKMAGEMGGDGTMDVSTGDSAMQEVVTGERPHHNTAAEEPASVRREVDPGDLNAKPRWQRVLIGFAGPVSNLILAFVLMAGLFMMHSEVPDYVRQPVVLDPVPSGSPAGHAGLEAGDRITSFDGERQPSYEQVGMRVGIGVNSTVPISIDRNGRTIDTGIAVPATNKPEDLTPEALGIFTRVQTTPIGVMEVEPGMPAEAAGLKPGDLIESMDGNQFHYVRSLLAFLQQSDGKPVHLVVRRSGQSLNMTVQPTLVPAPEEPSGKQYRLGFRPTEPPYHVEQLSLPAAAHLSFTTNMHNGGAIVTVLRRLFTRSNTVRQLSGPIGMARVTGEAFSTPGWQPTIDLMALISLNLGIFNLLPFPVLDGGMIMLLVIEGLIRRDINQQFKERIYQVAFVVLILFFAFVMFNDFSRLPLFSHLKP